MSVYKRWADGIVNRCADTMIDCLHSDFVFIRHQTNTTMNKTEMAEMLRSFLSNDAVVVQTQRCIFENDSIMVEHSVMDFPDGTREAILSANTLKDGLIIRTETGATLVKND